MPNRDRPAAGRHRSAFRDFPRWRYRLAWLLLAALAATTFAASIVCLALHARAENAEHLLVPAGFLLAASATAQFWLLQEAWRRGDRLSILPLTKLGFWRRFGWGAAAAYVLALTVGPRPNIAFLWLAATSVWVAALLWLPLTASPKIVEIWRRWKAARFVRRAGLAASAALALIAAIEVALRAERYFDRTDGSGLAALVSASVTAPAEITEADVKLLAARGGPLRIAVLVESAEHEAAAERGYLAQLTKRLPAVEIVPLRVERPWSNTIDSALWERVVACRPHLALAMVSVCEDLTRAAEPRNYFDWRQLELVQHLAGTLGWPLQPLPRPDVAQDDAAEDFESFLAMLSPQLEVCRTPIEPAMRSRWQRTLGSLDVLVARCQSARIPLALVVVPSEFQVNRALSATLVRRSGSGTEQFDFELPQRRLSGFAESRRVATLDLLPHLRLARGTLYGRNSIAWNEQGHAVAASTLAAWLESRLASQITPPAQLSSAP